MVRDIESLEGECNDSANALMITGRVKEPLLLTAKELWGMEAEGIHPASSPFCAPVLA